MALTKVVDDPGIKICGLRPIQSIRLRRVYEALLSDGRTLEVVIPPPLMLKLLRSERQNLDSEAVVVPWLSNFLSEQVHDLPGPKQDEESEESSPGSPRAQENELGYKDRQHLHLETAEGSGLRHLLPHLLALSVSQTSLSAPCSVYLRRKSSTIAGLPTPLTTQQRADADFQLGRLMRQLAEIRSPTGRFGYVGSVLAPEHAEVGTKDKHRLPTPSASGREVARTWSTAFNLIFDAVLRDAEDMAIMLAYSMIRKHLARLSYILDEVTVPSLVVMDGTEDNNVLVAFEPVLEHTHGIKHTQGSTDEVADSWEVSSDGGHEEEEETTSDGAWLALDHTVLGGDLSDSHVTDGHKLQVVGLQDWSNVIFGDPLLATAFSNKPSDELRDGYNGTATAQGSKILSSEDQDDSTKARLLLYQAYHAVVTIVTEFYRPQVDSTARELAARRKLTEALMKLEEIEDDPKQGRNRRPSGEMSPAKKLKADDEERHPTSRAP
jgi:hypothetical protein